MIFWALLVIAIVVIVGTFLVWSEDSIGFGFAGAVLTACISVLVGGGLLALALLIPGHAVREETYPLRALKSGSTIEGRFYLGSGYVNGERSLNYIKQGDGYSVVDSGVGYASRVFEDTDRPTVTEYEHIYSNGWVIPWEFTTGHSWDFHIPKGSILEDYTITNE